MRNPINAILASNLKLHESVQELNQIVLLIQRYQLNEEMSNYIESINEKTDEITDMQKMTDSATKLLNFYVGDLLCLAQIDKGVLLKMNS